MSLKIPSHFDFGIDLGLDIHGIPTEYGISIHELPPIKIELAPIEIKPLDFSLRLKEIPSIRAHFPLDFKVGFGLFGTENPTENARESTESPSEPRDIRQPVIATSDK